MHNCPLFRVRWFLVPDMQDSWSYIWGNGLFSLQKAYKHMKRHIEVHASFKWIWKSSCQLKHRIFFWLICKDRLNTRGMLRRRNMHLEDYSCVFCTNSEDETTRQLNCPFAQQCWGSLNLLTTLSWSCFDTFERLRQQIVAAFFMEIMILLSWSIWITRNNLIFNAIQP